MDDTNTWNGIPDGVVLPPSAGAGRPDDSADGGPAFVETTDSGKVVHDGR